MQLPEKKIESSAIKVANVENSLNFKQLKDVDDTIDFSE